MAATAGRRFSDADGNLAGWAALAVLGALAAWALSGEGTGRYAIYALPPGILMLAVLLSNGAPRLDANAAKGVQLFGLVAALSIASNGYLGAYAVRDLLIVGGYLCLYALSFRAPKWTADVVLATLVASMAAESMRMPPQSEVQLLESEGVMESTFAFPLGALFIHYVLERKWMRAALTFVVFFIAFKRIALAAALAALAVHFCVRLFRLGRWEKAIAIAIMLASSIIALYTMEIFELMADEVGRTNANGVSLGRYNFAEALWAAWSRGGVSQLLFGFGPGEADAVVMKAFDYNPHNDWLKILFEYGVAGLVAFYAILAWVFGRNGFTLTLLTYVSILMVTDNTLIYMHFHAPIFLLAMIPFAERAGRAR